MPLTQVVKNEETGKKELQVVPGFSGGGSGDSSAALAAAQEAKALAESAKTTADKGVADAAAAQETADGKVSKTGDTMTGPLRFENTEEAIDSIRITLPINAREIIIPENTIFRDIQFAGKDVGRFGLLRYGIEPNTGKRHIDIMTANDKNSLAGSISLIHDIADTNNIYASCPPPRENVNENDIDTRAASVARHPQRSADGINNVTLYVDAVNGNDTANLNAGRGSKDLPFKSLMAALMYGAAYHAGNFGITVRLLSDCDITGNGPFIPANSALNRVVINSASGKVTVNLKTSIKIAFGNVVLGNLNINTENAVTIQCQGETQSAVLWLQDCSIVANGFGISISGPGAYAYISGNSVTGTANTYGLLTVNKGAHMQVITNGLTGSVTGKKYMVSNGSTLLLNGAGADAIPGTEAGVVDASSRVI